jgi:hypothetical protein
VACATHTHTHTQREDLSSEQRRVLEVMQRTFATYITGAHDMAACGAA